MSLWVSFDIELPQSRKFLRLEALDPRHPMMLLRLVGVAKRANEDGRVADLEGEPLAATDLAAILPGTQVEWETFIRDATELGFLLEENGCLVISDWPRWVKKPSDAAESVKERVRRYRESRRPAPPPPCNADVTPEKRPVTDGGSESENPSVTDVTQHSTAQHEHSTAEHAPPTPPPGGEGALSEIDLVVVECSDLVQAFHRAPLKPKLQNDLAATVRSLMLAGTTPAQVVALCRRAITHLTGSALSQPAYVVPDQMRKFAPEPPPPNGGSGKPKAHPRSCDCPVCQLTRDVQRWGDDFPLPGAGEPAASLRRQDILETFLRDNHAFLPDLTEDQLRAGFVDALSRVEDVQVHVRDTVRALAQRLKAPARASPPRHAPQCAIASPEPAAAG